MSARAVASQACVSSQLPSNLSRIVLFRRCPLSCTFTHAFLFYHIGQSLDLAGVRANPFRSSLVNAFAYWTRSTRFTTLCSPSFTERSNSTCRIADTLRIPSACCVLFFVFVFSVLYRVIQITGSQKLPSVNSTFTIVPFFFLRGHLATTTLNKQKGNLHIKKKKKLNTGPLSQPFLFSLAVLLNYTFLLILP